MKTIVTLKDIAKIAGINISTVSKALRGSTDLSEETKLKVIEIAKQLNYPFKQNEDTQKANFGLIGVVCPEIKSDYYSQVVSILEEEIKKEGYFTIIGFTNFEHDNEKYYLEQLIKANVSGIVFISESNDLGDILAKHKSQTDIPLVLISQDTDTKDFDCIKIDDNYGVRLAVEHLIAAGHKKICYIGDELTTTRLNIFSEIMAENNINVNDDWIQVSNERFEKCGYDLINNILNCSDIPTAVIGAYDDIAIGAVKGLCDKGFKVPEDFSVVGIDNIKVTEYYCPEITTVAGPVEEMGKIAVKLLFKKVKDKQYNVIQNVKLSPKLIERRSVRNLNNI